VKPVFSQARKEYTAKDLEGIPDRLNKNPFKYYVILRQETCRQIVSFNMERIQPGLAKRTLELAAHELVDQLHKQEKRHRYW
jgi:hypothetical protein